MKTKWRHHSFLYRETIYTMMLMRICMHIKIHDGGDFMFNNSWYWILKATLHWKSFIFLYSFSVITERSNHNRSSLKQGLRLSSGQEGHTKWPLAKVRQHLNIDFPGLHNAKRTMHTCLVWMWTSVVLNHSSYFGPSLALEKSSVSNQF